MLSTLLYLQMVAAGDKMTVSTNVCGTVEHVQ